MMEIKNDTNPKKLEQLIARDEAVSTATIDAITSHNQLLIAEISAKIDDATAEIVKQHIERQNELIADCNEYANSYTLKSKEYDNLNMKYKGREAMLQQLYDAQIRCEHFPLYSTMLMDLNRKFNWLKAKNIVTTMLLGFSIAALIITNM